MRSPGLLLVLAYRLLGWRLGPSYADWVRDDLTRPGWLLRQGAPVAAVLLVLAALIGSAAGARGGRLLSLIVVLLAGGLFLRNTLRERSFRQQGLAPSGEPPAEWFTDEAARRRRNLVSAISTPALVVAGMLIVAFRSRH